MALALKRRLSAIRIVLEETAGTIHHAAVSTIQASAVVALVSSAGDLTPDDRSELSSVVLRLPFTDSDKTKILQELVSGIDQRPPKRLRRGYQYTLTTPAHQ
jgi:hypothetical protein